MWKDFRTLDTVTTTASSFAQIAVEDPVQAGAIAVSVTASLAESAGSVLHQAFIEGDPGAAAKTSAFVTEAVLTGGGARTIARNAGKALLNASNKAKSLATATIDKAKRATRAVINGAAQVAKSAQVLAQRTSSQLRTIAESFNESVNQRLFGGSTVFDPDVRVNGFVEEFNSKVTVSTFSLTPSTIITPELESKILFGRRTKNNDGNTSNRIIGAHSGEINNNHPDFAVELLSTNPDGTQNVKLITQFSDGSLSRIKRSTLFPDRLNNKDAIDAVKQTGNQPAISTRASDGATLHQATINGIQIEVIKRGNQVIAAYPCGRGCTDPSNFKGR